MPKARLDEKQARDVTIIDRLDAEMPEAELELDYETPPLATVRPHTLSEHRSRIIDA
jgi:hypothetical protein